MLALVCGSSTAAPPEPCDIRLVVTLTPDVPNPGDDEFLSSLLSDNTGYELTLQQRPSSSVVIVELIGPGPDYRCRSVVDDMRKDARVVSIDYVQLTR
jgi:hypothetical protein